MKIKHLLDENEKVSSFDSDAKFIEFVKLIAKENDDEGVFVLDTMKQAQNYIITYCDNLELIY